MRRGIYKKEMKKEERAKKIAYTRFFVNFLWDCVAQHTQLLYCFLYAYECRIHKLYFSIIKCFFFFSIFKHINPNLCCK